MQPHRRRRTLNLSPLVRKCAVTVTVAGIAAGVVLVSGIYAWGWSLGLGHTDRAGALGAALGLLGAAYAASAVVFALSAYLAATERPRLQADLHFNLSDPNEPVFKADTRSGASEGWLFASPTQQTHFAITITNSSKVAAHCPGLRVEFDGLKGVQVPAGWSAVEGISTYGATMLQWDGGLDYIIHGRWERYTPPLLINSPLAPVQIREQGADVILTLVADGVEPIVRTIPVRILRTGEYAAYLEERAAREERRQHEADPP